MKTTYKTVSDFGKIVTGKTPSTASSELWGGDIPFITPTDIVGYDMRYIYSTERYVSDKGKEKQAKTYLPPNAICVTCIASIGKLCLTKVPAITNQQINSIIVDENFDYEYLFYLFRYFQPYLQMIGGGTGSGTPIISKNKFARLKYPVIADKNVQKEIASILSTYDSLIETNNKRIKILEQMAENLYKEWFVRFRFPGYETAEFESGLPKGWRIDIIFNHFITSSGGTPSTSKPEYYIGDIPWVKTGELLDNYIFDTEEHITEDAITHSSAKLIRPGSLLLAMYAGSNVGKMGFVETECTCNQACCVFNEKSFVSLSYLFEYLKTQRDYLQSISFGAAQQNISQQILKKVKLIIPPAELIKMFSDKHSAFSNEIKHLLRENDNLIKQRDLLLPRLMSGKLEV